MIYIDGLVNIKDLLNVIGKEIEKVEIGINRFVYLRND
jgi:hypothetical protein